MNSSSTPVTATQAMRGMLELIRHTPSVAGLTPEAMGEQLGLPITKASADNYGYAQPLPDGWAFSIQRKQIANEGPRIDLIFAPRGEARLSPRSICEPDFAEFTRELENMGFTRHTGRGAHGRWTHDAFDRDGQQVRVYPVRDIDEKGAVTRTCVEMVLVR